MNSIDVVEDFNTIICFQDVSWAVAQKSSIQFVAFISNFSINFHFFVQIFIKNRIGVYQISFKVLFKHTNIFSVFQGFESDSLSLYVRWNISEVKNASSLIEIDGTNVLNNRELIIIDCDREWDRCLYGWCI